MPTFRFNKKKIEEWAVRFANRHPKIFRVCLRGALYQNPLLVERYFFGGWLVQVFGPVEARRWIEYLEKEKRRIYGGR